jgi:hypothetical protein
MFRVEYIASIYNLCTIQTPIGFSEDSTRMFKSEHYRTVLYTRGGKSQIIYILDFFIIHSIKFNSKLFFEILFMDIIGMYNVYNNPPPKKSFLLTNKE